VTDSNHVESTIVLFPQINHGRFWETSGFTLANSAWPSLRRSVQSVLLMLQWCYCLVTEADNTVVCSAINAIKATPGF